MTMTDVNSARLTGFTGAEAMLRGAPRIVGVSTAVPGDSYSQDELLDIFRIEDPRIRSVFRNSAIQRRFLTLPPAAPGGGRTIETQGELLRKHAGNGLEMGARALQSCLKNIDAELSDVRYLCCVTSTGFLTPGFSAMLIRELDLDPHCARLDVVGMGCNAGLNGLTATASWARANPGDLAVLLCVEVCSAAYVMDGTIETSVVNSLFGDGAAAAAIVAEPDMSSTGPALLRFSSLIIPEAIDAMRYQWDDIQGKFSFFLDREVPYVIGANVETALGRLLAGTGLRRPDITHWLVHSGGKKVIDSVMINLALTRHDVRHTTTVLRDYGNLSSGSFLFSYDRLIEERSPRPGDYGVLMTMGPGSTIEMALIRW
ncbi:3,5-dihydroxyphenylacetyl-CoA synthase DpgA [Dactylosporangium sucinum]|uniref:Naringenin-chalcone synthase n=1 Tax=Dactylosporangium sucinum TaxID=1424081 RepID=A0A917X5H2_9ACTN|nr:3,5-dihydroxyphenylacetyl-CoA synthase DpgA [Dactylosporangium sucinum]GGM71033.1 naringenin-chalcone synthase [Dactylosporangium sucinum]